MAYGGIPYGGIDPAPGSGGSGGGPGLLTAELLRLVTWFVPPQITDLPSTRPSRIRLIVLDADTGAAVDPSSVTLTLTLNGVLQAVYALGAPGSPIVRENAGVFRASFSQLNAGRWQGLWTCLGGEQSFEFSVFAVA